MNHPPITLRQFENEAQWAQAAAQEIGSAISEDISTQGQAHLLVSGGTTPAPVYETLAKLPLEWAKISVGLVDERWNPSDPHASNAWLLQNHFLRFAPHVSFTSLVTEGYSLEECVNQANHRAKTAPPASVAVLGMGNDGHTASLFPEASDLASAVHSAHPYAALRADGCPVAAPWTTRITLTPMGLANSRRRILLLRGHTKRDVLDAALASKDALRYPILYAIGQPAPALHVFWCP